MKTTKKHGTWDTWNVEPGKLEEQKEFLDKRMEDIPGGIRVKINHHEFKDYPSFEVFMPNWIKAIKELPEDERDEDDWNDYDNWIDQITDLERELVERFSE